MKETKAPAEAAQVSEMQKMPVQTQLEQLLAALKESEWRWRVRSRFEDTHGVGAKATDEESVAAVQTMQTMLRRIERGRGAERM